MSIFAKMKGSSTPEASKSRGNRTPEVAPPSESAVRLKPYSGLETKTLWNHFNKDDLMTISEVTSLLDRVLMKDATDVYADVKQTKAWKDYCSQALRIMDSSNGTTVDLQEFTAEFNSFYLNRMYYLVKCLVPALHKVLRKVCEEAGFDAERMSEIAAIMAGGGKEKEKVQVRVEEKIVIQEADKTAELAEIVKLKESIEKLGSEIEAIRAEGGAELAAAKEAADRTIAENDEERRALEQRFEAEKASLNEQISSLKTEIEKMTVHDIESSRASTARATAQETEIESLKHQLRTALQDVEIAKLLGKDKIELLEEENRGLKSRAFKEVDEWKSKFDEIIKENVDCRNLFAGLKADVIRLNAELLERQLEDRRRKETAPFTMASVHSVALSGISLDPFRAELVQQFGSIDNVMGKRTKLTLNEMELIATSIGYSREYSRKLFYALDVKNRGFLSAEQFARPLPVLNDELCLLTKSST